MQVSYTLVLMYWYLNASGVDKCQGALEEIWAVGVSCKPSNDPFPRGPGILFFQEASEGVCALLRDLSAAGAEVLAVEVSTAAAPVESNWRLLAAGASDVLHQESAKNWAVQAKARLERWQAVSDLLDSPLVREHLVGDSKPWRAALRQAILLARFTDASILITGETGTGKELIARLIHTLDPRPDKRELIIADCTTIVPTLSGSEFFGHERGAYTGAAAARDGAFAMADRGTLFLDEVGELPAELQSQLLRVVQEGTYKRVGGNSWRETRFRLVCATNRDLAGMAERGEFRRDLYYRIVAGSCHLPPLRDRLEDILPLARHFLRQLRPGVPTEMDPAVESYLLRRGYPGNVRELRQLIARMSYHSVGMGPLSAGDIPVDERTPAPDEFSLAADPAFTRSIQLALDHGDGLKDITRAAGDMAIRLAVAREAGNLRRASRRLGVTDRALQIRRSQQKERRQYPADAA